MRVVENRVAVDDVQPTWGNDLNFRFETTFDVVKLGRLALLRPSLPLGYVDEVYDRALDSLISANLDHRLFARASAGLDILGRNDLSCRHVATVDDDPLNGTAVGNSTDFV